MSFPSFDVGIVGAGPAGCATAIHLAGFGRRVLLIDKHHPPVRKIGESLPPKASPALRRLGILNRMDEAGSLPYLGNRSCWGSDEPLFHDFIREPFGRGWRLERDRFELLLRQTAIDRGVTFMHGSAQPIQNQITGHWLALQTTEQFTVHVGWLVDATGRNSTVAAKLGAARQAFDSLVAHVLFAEGVSDDDHFLTIESQPTGWWYSVALSSGVVAVLHALPRQIENEAGLLSLLAQTKLVKAKMPVSAPAGKLERVLANSSKLDLPVGDGWTAVGDASTAFDPISSYGILHALQSGILAAESINSALSGKTDSLSYYAQHEAGVFARHLIKRREAYRAENRWPDSTFWNSAQK